MARTNARSAPNNLPVSARAVIFHGAAKGLRLESVPLTAPADGEILVRITACTVCGSDLHTIEGRRTTPTPTILGHEIIGEIAALPPGEDCADLSGATLRVGDRVTWAIAASCGACFYCAGGLPQKCEHLFKYGHESLDTSPRLSGGLAQYCHLARGSHLLRLPEGLPAAVACPANCATATVAAAFRAGGGCLGQDVLVQGAGLLGLTACAMAKTKGARSVVLADPHAGRLARGEVFGADALINPGASSAGKTLIAQGNSGRGYDLILEMSGAHAAMKQGLELLRMGGRYVWVGAVFPGPPLPIQPEHIARRWLTIAGVHNYASGDLVEAVAFLAAHHGEYPFEGLVAAWYPLEQFQSAIQFAFAEHPVRVGIRP